MDEIKSVDAIKCFEWNSYPNDLQINFWLGHGIKVTMVDNDKNPFVNVANKGKLIEMRNLLDELIESMP